MEEEIKGYLPIGCLRLMDIRVIWDDEFLKYEGPAEDATADVKKMIYSKMEKKDKMVVYVYSKFNQ